MIQIDDQLSIDSPRSRRSNGSRNSRNSRNSNASKKNSKRANPSTELSKSDIAKNKPQPRTRKTGVNLKGLNPPKSGMPPLGGSVGNVLTATVPKKKKVK